MALEQQKCLKVGAPLSLSLDANSVLTHDTCWTAPDSKDPADMDNLDTCHRIYAMGSLLLATEVRSAQRYWHVRSVNVTGLQRVYPGNLSCAYMAASLQ
jgi:hypothetical protein